MKKILFVVHNLIIGGVEKVCWEIINNIDLGKYQIDFLVATNEDIHQYYEPFILEKGCKIYKGGYILDSESKSHFLKFEEELLKRNKYDIVHAHMDFMNIWILRIAKKMGIKVRISHVHTTEIDNNSSALNRIKYKIQRFLMNYYATQKLGCSRAACDCYYGRHNGKTIFNGFNIKSYMNISDEKRLPYTFITIGRIDIQKNPFFIVEVMKELVALNNNFHLIWIGSGRLFEQIKQKIEDVDLTNSITLVGATTQIKEYMEKSSYSVFPSIYEGLGIALVETQLAQIFTFYSDVIPEEANIGYAKKFSLSLSAKEWAEQINTFVMKNEKNKYNIDMEKANKYDIKSTVAQLCEYYNGK